MIIRKAVLSDIPQLVDMRWMHIMSYAENQSKNIVNKKIFIQKCSDFLKKGIESGQWVIFIAEQDKKLIGHTYIQIIQKVPKPYALYCSWGYVTNMYVEEHYRSQGIGTMLLDATKKWGTEQQLELLLLWPSEKAVSFYERNGFKQPHCMQYTINED